MSNYDPILQGHELDARAALKRIAANDGKNLEHWADFGKALAGGRELFPNDDKGFGKWKKSNIYSHTKVKADANTEVAAMWMAAHPEQVAEVRKLKPTVFAPRKLHEFWKKRVDELLAEGDFRNDEELVEVASEIGATADDVEQARKRAEARDQKGKEALAVELQIKSLEEDIVEARAQMLATRKLEQMLAKLPDELQAAVREHLAIEKPKRGRKPKAKAPTEEGSNETPEAA